MTYRIDIQKAVSRTFIPSNKQLQLWATKALHKKIKSAEISIRIVNQKEMTALNKTYRQKSGPTNVLSFPSDMPKKYQTVLPFLGDIVICAAIVNREATKQQKPKKAHWAHIVIHGILHLLGFDHETKKAAAIMEPLEIRLLKVLGFANPYQQGVKERS